MCISVGVEALEREKICVPKDGFIKHSFRAAPCIDRKLNEK